MADQGQRVSLEAVFKSVGLDRLGRDFDGVAQRIKRMGEAMKSWGAPAGQQGGFAKQFQVGMEVEQSQVRLRRAGEVYKRLSDEMAKTQDPQKRARLENHLQSVVRIGERELSLQDRLNRKEVERHSNLMRSANLRRGLRLGLSVMGLPVSVAAAGRGIGEAMEQEKGTLGMAARLRETMPPIRDFTEYTMDLRKSIVAAGAEFAYSGREAIALADNLSSLAGGMVDMREVFAMARGFGMAPQVAGQYMASARRFGGREAPPDEKLMNIVAKGIATSGMAPRSSEFVQAVVAAMQTYSSRLPAVMPGTLTNILAALSSEQGIGGGPGVGRLAPTLRGQGGMQVISGMTAMMDDMSEAMVAIQTELVARDPKAFEKTAKGLGIDTAKGSLGGSERYLLTMALKQAGVADQDGMKLAGRTIKEITRGMDTTTRMALETTLLRLSPQLVAALEKSGFMDAVRDGKISEDQFSKRINQLRGQEAGVMETPAMVWGKLGRMMAADVATQFESRVVAPFAPEVSAFMDMKSEGKAGWLALPGLATMSAARAMGNYAAENPWSAMRRAGVGLGVGGSVLSGGSMAIPSVMAGAGLYGLGSAGEAISNATRGMSGSTFKHAIDLTVTVSGGASAESLSGKIANLVGSLLRDNLNQVVNNGQSVEVGGMGHNLNADKTGHR